jgi:hypothetical protein
MKKLDICCELWVNFKITLARCHHERGDSRATDLTMVHAVEAVDGNASASCGAGVPRTCTSDIHIP